MVLRDGADTILCKVEVYAWIELGWRTHYIPGKNPHLPCNCYASKCPSKLLQGFGQDCDSNSDGTAIHPALTRSSN